MPKYVVLSDAMVVSTDKTKKNGRPETARILRGGVFTGKADSETVRDLLRRGVIAEAKNREEAARLSSKHLPVREIAKRSGAEDDPVQAPQEEILPVAPSGGHVEPGSVTADTASDDESPGAEGE